MQLGEAGLNLLIVGRRPELLSDLATRLAEFSNIKTQVVVADLATPIGIETVEDACEDLDVGLLVAAAGFGTSGPFLDANLPVELEMLAVNCTALLGECLFFGRRFAKRGRGGIILMASIFSFQGVPFCASYAATKAYVQNLAEALYVELRPLGIDVVASAPGPVRSGFQAVLEQIVNEDVKRILIDLFPRTQSGFERFAIPIGKRTTFNGTKGP